VPSATAFADHLRVIWLVPEMDGLFLGPAAERRRFLDRLVLAIDAAHGSRVNALERALRSRNRLLEDPSPDPRWLDAIEHEVAELGIAVAAARAETVRRLMGQIESSRDPASLFPSAFAHPGRLAGGGACRQFRHRNRGSVSCELARGAAARPRRRADAGRPAPFGSRGLSCRKKIPAARASTGERKALLVGVVLSHARLVAAMHGAAPVVLLDDVAAFSTRIGARPCSKR
jgi:DNA replication and repair protein RecF